MDDGINKLSIQVTDLERRVSLLENLVGNESIFPVEKRNEKLKPAKYAGPKGGVLLLVKEGFLKTKKNAREVWLELDKKGYVYEKDVVQTALNRLSGQKGLLVKIEVDGKKMYVERK